MKKKTFIISLLSGALAIAIATIIFNKNSAIYTTAIHEHVGYHYYEKDPKFESGVHEYWVCCDCHEHFLEQPEGTFENRSISDDFSVASTDDRYLAPLDDLSGMRAEGAMISGSASYTISEITSGFLSNDANARIGLKFDKQVTTNEYSTYEFEINKTLHANSRYTLTYVIDRFAGAGSAYSSFRGGLKGVTKSTEGNFQPNPYDVNNKKVECLNGATYETSDYTEVKDNATGGYLFTYHITFLTGEEDVENLVFELNLNYTTNTGSCALTKFTIEEDALYGIAKQDLCGMSHQGAIKTGSGVYTVSTVTSGFLPSDTSARIGIDFLKDNTTNSSSTYQFNTCKVLKADTKYTVRMILNSYAGSASNYSSLRIGVKDLIKSSEGSFPASGWDIANKKLTGINGAQFLTSSYQEAKDNETGGYVMTESFTFITGSTDVNFVFDVLLNYQAAAGHCTITKLLLIEDEFYNIAKEDLSGLQKDNAMKTGSASYTISEITSGFLSNDTNARVGILFSKTVTTNEYSTYEFRTNKVLEAGQKYKISYAIDRFAGAGSAYSSFRGGLKGVTKSTEGNFQPNPYDVNTGKATCCEGFTYNGGAYSEVKDEATGGYLFTYYMTFTVGEEGIVNPIFELNLNYTTNTGSCALTKLLIEKVSA